MKKHPHRCFGEHSISWEGMMSERKLSDFNVRASTGDTCISLIIAVFLLLCEILILGFLFSLFPHGDVHLMRVVAPFTTIILIELFSPIPEIAITRIVSEVRESEIRDKLSPTSGLWVRMFYCVFRQHPLLSCRTLMVRLGVISVILYAMYMCTLIYPNAWLLITYILMFYTARKFCLHTLSY